MSQDPYVPPKSRVEDFLGSSPAHTRPVVVWLITIFYGFSAAAALRFPLLILFGAIAPPDWDAIDYLISVGVALLNLWGVTFLFLLRAKALHILLAALLVVVTHRLYRYVSTDVFSLNGWLILWAPLCAYAFRLKAKGVLR